MTQREFTERTGVEVSVNEYAAIEMVYMASDVDKDEFCRMWVKMNKSRVERAKAEAKARAEMDAQKERAFNIHSRINTLGYEKASRRAIDLLTCSERQFCEEVVGIDAMTIYYADGFSIAYDLGVFCGAIK